MRGKRKILLLLGDIVVLLASFYLTIIVGYWGSFNMRNVETHIFPFSLMYVAWIMVLFIMNLYDYSSIKPTIGNIRNISVALIIFAAVGVIFFYSFPIFGISPKMNLVINVVIFGALFIGWRRVFFAIFSKHFRKDVLILGENEKSQDLAQAIKNNPHIGYNFVGFIEDVSDMERIEGVGAVVVAKDFHLDSKHIHHLMCSDTEIMNIVEAYEKIFLKVPIEFINEEWFIKNIKNSRKVFYYKLKRFFDVLISTLVFVVALPFMLFIAMGIKIEDGRGVFYKQKRVGLYNKTFYLYKFQTYIANAEQHGAEWSQENDPRITRFGKFLRYTHLDELPQILNVLRGDISLVGPRPERPEFVTPLEKEIPYFDLRHVIKPGVTGWAQVKFKYAGTVLESYQKFEYDMYYAKNQNLFMDFGIIFRTIQKLF